MSKRDEILKTAMTAAIFTLTSYILVKFVLEKYLPGPKKAGELDGLGCDCQNAPWPYGRQG